MNLGTVLRRILMLETPMNLYNIAHISTKITSNNFKVISVTAFDKLSGYCDLFLKPRSTFDLV